MTRVSVITPFLDAEAYVREAIDSVRAQTVSDWELLLVDDGSSDASASIVRSAAEADSRIRLLIRPAELRAGAAAARNLGIAEACGKFLAFLDADDLLEPDMLAVTLEAAERHPSAAMIFGPTLWWHIDGGRAWLEPTYGREARLHRPPDLVRSLILLEQGQVPCTCSVLALRSAVQAVGGFELQFRLYEDQTLWVKLFSRYDVYVTPVPLSRYRQHPGSVSAGAAAAGEYDRMRAHSARHAFLAWVEGYLQASGVADARLTRALRLAQAPYGKRTAERLLDRWMLALHRWCWRFHTRIRRIVDRFGPPRARRAGAPVAAPPSDHRGQ